MPSCLRCRRSAERSVPGGPLAVAQEKEKRIRDWREIAADAVKEKYLEKLLLLMAEF